MIRRENEVLDLPELPSIRLGESAFLFQKTDESPTLVMRSGVS